MLAFLARLLELVHDLNYWSATVLPVLAHQSQHTRLPRTMPLQGGPCTHCGTDVSSLWYGKRNQPKYCKKRACSKAGGYLKQPGRGADPPPDSNRKRSAAPEEPRTAPPPPLPSTATISDVYACLGFRCALPCPAEAAPLRKQAVARTAADHRAAVSSC